MPITEPPAWCRSRIWPTWANHWVSCGGAVNQATGRCYQYGHPRKPEEADVANPTMPPSTPGAQDECATCSHGRYRHNPDQPDGHGSTPCERASCACGGVFVELSYGTRMARFVEAAQNVAATMAGVRTAMTEAFRAFHHLHAAMQQAGLLPEEEPGLCDGCDTVTQVTATDDGRAQLCDSCKRVAANIAQEEAAAPRGPALQQLATFHHVDCDGTDRTTGGTCEGTCTQGRSAADIVQRQIMAYPHATTRQQDNLHGPMTPSPYGPDEPPHTEDGPNHPRMTDEPPARAMIGNSCATCWPRPCDTNRSECLRRTGPPPVDLELPTRTPPTYHPEGDNRGPEHTNPTA